jgi:hypothetical protein
MFSLLLVALTHPAYASEIKVSLFGQPCVLTGPVEESVLQTVHSISPEKIPTPETADQARRDLAALGKVQAIPPDLDRYRDLLTKRLEAHQIFLEALAGAKRAAKPDTVLSAVKPLFEAKKFRSFQDQVRKAWTAVPTPAVLEQVKEQFERFAPPDPQEEFHRAIRRMKVTYDCTFEDGEHAEHEDEEEADAPGPSPTASALPSKR